MKMTEEELPEDKIVYQWDSGWWYDWDLSDVPSKHFSVRG